MAAGKSRDFIIKKNAVAIAGVTSKSVAIAKEPIDITTDSDDGFRTFLADAGTKSLDISFSGVTKDKIMRELIITDQTVLLTDITIEYPDGSTISGSFVFNGFTENGGSSDGAVEFDGTLQSSGTWVYVSGV